MNKINTLVLLLQKQTKDLSRSIQSATQQQTENTDIKKISDLKKRIGS